LISDGGETEVDASFVVDVTQPQHPGTRREERRPRSFIASGAEDLGEVGVGEAAGGVELGTQGGGVGGAGGDGGQGLGGAGGRRAPVGAAAGGGEDALGGGEVAVQAGGADELVDGHVRGGAAGGGGQPEVVGRGETDLDREADPPVAALDGLPELAQHV